MSWTKDDSSAGAPKYKIHANSANTGTQEFGTTVVGLGDGEYNNKKNHTGWTRVQRGTGPVASIAITAAGSGYANTNFVRVSGGTTNAYAAVTTNGSGGITALDLVAGSVGAGFVNNSTLTVAVMTAGSTGGAASAGTGATFTVTLGGRANRVQTETLVALTGMTSNNSTLA